ncbi:MAG: HAD-IB family hydrolase [Alphaproteobacteria bacterium]|nr:HAD-IB family hydrolase [Alphaproteobacteria bacterium]
MGAAYFDVDGTLVGTNLIHPTVMYLLNQPTPMRSLKRFGSALLSAPMLAMAEARDRRLFNELLFSHYKGMSEDRMLGLADEVFEKVVRPRIFKGAADLVTKCQEAGLRVVLITGSLDYTIRPLAEFLDINPDDIITNRLEMKDRYATGKLMRPVVAGPGKAKLIVDDAKAHGHELMACHAYSDSYSDVPMLSVVGHPFCVNPEPRLERLANAYDWPILDVDQPARGMKGMR